ncbi:Alpha/Beta hydrolase protein [Exophiala viscosa]|uniref:Alpha/Beta hydrolase protein n=1 Tax=Exophiala viscosa TaxID=2486360 RepID=A0AAN6IBU2_9EURO|nr:Alpha/Beta hydrolase protein [Exophiala viscosa]
MSDFSEHGIPSEEWKTLEAGLPKAVAGDQSVEDLKLATNKGREDVARREMGPLSDKVSIKDHTIATRDRYALEARTYRPSSTSPGESLPIYMHFHGGGFLFGTLSSEDAICSRIAINTGVLVVNINYRHTPEHGYPMAWNDSEDALQWVAKHASEFGGDAGRIVVGGVSAGAWLSAALTQTNHRAPAAERINILGQVLMIPCLVYQECYQTQLAQLTDPAVSSYVQNEHAPILPVSRMQLFNSLLKVEKPDPEDRRLNPGLATAVDVSGLPATTLGIAGSDPLRDEGLLYGKLLAENGVPTTIHVFQGLPHGFRRFGEKLSACAVWDDVMEDGIRQALKRPPRSMEYKIQVH